VTLSLALKTPGVAIKSLDLSGNAIGVTPCPSFDRYLNINM
jgi:hypothetical protein